MKRIAWYTTLVLLTLSVLVLLWQFRSALLMFVLSLATAAAFRPAINTLVGRGFRRGLAILLVYIFTLVTIGGCLFLLSGPLVRDLQQATDNLVRIYDNAVNRWPIEGSAFQQAIARRLPPLEDLYASITGEQASAVVGSFMGIATNLFGLISNLVIILILSMYWSADNVRFERLWLSLIPVERRIQARNVWRATESGVGSYIRSRLIQGLVTGGMLWIGYWTLDLPYPALLAVIGAFSRLIPWIGTILALIPPFLIGLGISPGLGLLAAIFTLMVLVVMELVISPRFFARQDYSSLLIVLVAIALAQAFGILGLILAPALAVAIQIVFEKTVQYPMAPAPSTEILEQANGKVPESVPVEIDTLREKLAGVRESLNNGDGPPAPEVMSLINRLEGLMDKTRKYLIFGEKSR